MAVPIVITVQDDEQGFSQGQDLLHQARGKMDKRKAREKRKPEAGNAVTARGLEAPRGSTTLLLQQSLAFECR